jgi:hypothetical protein
LKRVGGEKVEGVKWQDLKQENGIPGKDVKGSYNTYHHSNHMHLYTARACLEDNKFRRVAGM